MVVRKEILAGATAAIKQNMPQVEVVVMTSFIEDEKVFGAMRAGATGYVLKDADPEEVVNAIRSAAAGESPLDPRVVRRLMQEFTPTKPKAESSQEPLSERWAEWEGPRPVGISDDRLATGQPMATGPLSRRRPLETELAPAMQSSS